MNSNNDKLYNLYLQLEPVIAEVEKQRKSALSMLIVVGSIIFFVVLQSALTLSSKISPSSLEILLDWRSILVLLAWITIYILSLTCIIWKILRAILFGKKYKEVFKETIITSLLKSFSTRDIIYKPYSSIKFSIIRSSLLWHEAEYYDKSSSISSGKGYMYLKGDDFIQGQNFIGSEILLGNIIFRGLFIIIDLPKNTKTAFGTSTNISDNKILLDNTEFNELFPIYAENTTEAFYILPSNLLERMVNFVRKTGRKFDFSVVDNKFYIAIPYNRELLEPPIFKSLFDYSIYEEYLTDLELAIGIVEDLKLA